MKAFNTPIHFVVFALVLMFSSTVYGQQPKPGSKKDRVQQLKIAFITQELDLSEEEAQKFWPVYNDMEKKMKDQRKTRRRTTNELKNGFDTMSEAEIKTKTTSILNSEVKEAEIKREYIQKIAGIIGYKKATKLLSLEQRFKKELLKKLNNNQQSGNGPRQNRPRARGGR